MFSTYKNTLPMIAKSLRSLLLIV